MGNDMDKYPVKTFCIETKDGHILRSRKWRVAEAYKRRESYILRDIWENGNYASRPSFSPDSVCHFKTSSSG